MHLRGIVTEPTICYTSAKEQRKHHKFFHLKIVLYKVIKVAVYCHVHKMLDPVKNWLFNNILGVYRGIHYLSYFLLKNINCEYWLVFSQLIFEPRREKTGFLHM